MYSERSARVAVPRQTLRRAEDLEVLGTEEVDESEDVKGEARTVEAEWDWDSLGDAAGYRSGEKRLRT